MSSSSLMGDPFGREFGVNDVTDLVLHVVDPRKDGVSRGGDDGLGLQPFEPVLNGGGSELAGDTVGVEDLGFEGGPLDVVIGHCSSLKQSHSRFSANFCGVIP